MRAIESRDEPLRVRRLGSRLRLHAYIYLLHAHHVQLTIVQMKAGPMQVESSEPRSAGRTSWHCSSVAEAGCAASSGCLAASQDARCRATAIRVRRRRATVGTAARLHRSRAGVRESCARVQREVPAAVSDLQSYPESYSHTRTRHRAAWETALRERGGCGSLDRRQRRAEWRE